MMSIKLRVCRKCNHPETEDRPFISGRNQCKQCRFTYLAERRRMNHAQVLQWQRQSYKNHRIEYNNQSQQRYLNNVDNILKRQSSSYQAAKIAVFMHYGLKCALCPETKLEALQIDHIDGRGGIKRQRNIYRYLRNHGFPSGFRTLCANCNWKEYLRRKPTSMSERGLAIKAGVMAIMGGICVECGCDDLDVLTVQHISNNGAAHRRAVSYGNGGLSFYRALLESDDYVGLECLCFNCNCSHASHTGLGELINQLVNIPI